jgi:Transposase
VLFIGDEWAEDHHDVELVDEGGRRLARARLPEGLEGLSRLHALIAEHLPEEWADLPAEEAARRVVIGIETDRGPWVRALIAAGYVVFAINPMQVARYRERHSTSGAKSDAGTRTCWLRSSVWTASITARSPATVRTPRRSNCWPGPSEPDLGPDAAGVAAAQCVAGVLPGCAGGLR